MMQAVLGQFFYLFIGPKERKELRNVRLCWRADRETSSA